MNNDSITTFIKSVINKNKQNRYLGFLSTEKGQKKFLASLDHDLERDLKDALPIEKFSEPEWATNCFLYSSRGEFNSPQVSFKSAYENAAWDGGWLLISDSGKRAIFRPEGRMDGEFFFKL